jgi:hypothetical protein
MEKGPYREANSSSASQATWRFTTVYTTAYPLPFSSTKSMQSTTSRPTPLISVLILSIQLRLSLPNGLLSSGFRTISLHILLPHACHMHVHPNPIDLIALRVFDKQHKSRGFSLCTFLQHHVPCSLVRSKIYLSTPFPITTNPCFTLHVKDQH